MGQWVVVDGFCSNGGAPNRDLNAAQVSFWQNECRDQTCPAGDDGGSLASVFPVDESETQRAVEGEGNSDDEQSFFWFVVLAGALLVAAVLSWCAFWLCCRVSARVWQWWWREWVEAFFWMRLEWRRLCACS